MAANCTCPDCRHKKATDLVRRHSARDDYTGAVHAAVSYLQAELKKDRDHRPSESPAVHVTVAGKILLLAGLVHSMRPPYRGQLEAFLAAVQPPQEGEHDDAA